MLQKCIFLFCFLETTETQQTSNLTTSNTPNEVNHEKNCFETRRSMVEIRRFNIELSMSICARENFSHPAQFCLVFVFFAGISLSLLLDTIGTSGSSFLYIYIYFQHRNKTKTRNFTKLKQKLLYCTHCHTNV